MNPVERAIFVPRNDILSWPVCDALLVAAFLYPTEVIKQSKHCYAIVELQGLHTRGQVAIDPWDAKAPNVHMIQLIDETFCKKVLLWTADHPDVDI